MIWLIDFSVKVTLLLSAAWLVSLLLKRASADARHSLWLAALFGVAILALPISLPTPVTIGVPVQFSVDALGGALPQQARSGAWPLWTAIWSAGIIAAIMRLLTGIFTVASWTRRARHIASHVDNGVNDVLISDLASTPLTWGVFRPVILFPACATEWPADQMDLALRHERAHIGRRDWLWQMLANTINAIFWFHPLVWFANAELRREAENAADDLVLASGVDATDYAAQLVRVARRMSTMPPLAAVAMARKRVLESRVRQILNPLRHRGQASFAIRTVVIAIVCAVVVPLLAMQAKSVIPAGALQVPGFAIAPPGSAAIDAVTQGAAAAPMATRSAAPHAPLAKAEPSPSPRQAPVSASLPGVTGPRVLYKSEPAYTEDAKAAKIQGSVLLSLIVDEQGRPSEITVKKSLDPGLDDQAVQAVRQWQFTPGMKDGVPVPVTANIEVNFRLL